MPQTNVEELKRLVALLREHPEWQAALRDVLFPEYSPLTVREMLHELVHQVHSLVEAQQHTETRVQELAEAQKQTQAEVRALAEAQRRSEGRLDRLEATVAELVEAQKQIQAEVRALAEAQKRTEAQVAELAEAQRRTEERMNAEFERVWAAINKLTEQVEKLTKSVEHLRNEQKAMNVRLGALSGWYAELIFRDRAPAYLGTRGFLRVRVVPKQKWVRHLEDAYEAGQLSTEEWQDMLEADAIVQARKDGEIVYLVTEVSYTVSEHDVERAVRRTRIWSRLLPDTSIIPLVAGILISEDVLRVAKIEDVLVVQMPEEAV